MKGQDINVRHLYLDITAKTMEATIQKPAGILENAIAKPKCEDLLKSKRISHLDEFPNQGEFPSLGECSSS